jgi:Nif-specific regulatory protein
VIKLIVKQGAKTYTRYFADPEITIGRSEHHHLHITDRRASRNHCRIERIAEGYKVVDLGSQNGTRVNGQVVTQKVLAPGDRIEIGDVVIFYQKGEGVREKHWTARREQLAEKLRRDVEEFHRVRGEEGLFEAEKVFSQVLDRRGLSSLRSLEDRYRNLLKLQEINKAMNSELQASKLLALIIDTAIEITQAARGFIILFNREGKMEVPVARNFDREAIHKAEFKISKSIAEQVGLSGRAVLTANASEDERFSSSMSVMKLQLSSILCVPVQSPGRMLGVIYLDNPFKEGVFSREDLALLQTFADQAAVALRNSILVEELKASRKKLLKINREWSESEERRMPAPKPAAKPKPRKDFKFKYDSIIGDSPRMVEVFEVLDKVIDSDVPILIQGESGTGKDLIARAIHSNSPRKDRRFVSENCAAIPDTLLESELFGYKKGAFTGANREKIGLFEVADGGTLFLDEIGDMSQDMQKKLLRVLQEGEFRPVGGGSTVKVNVRLISASNRDLRELIQKGVFREDLYYRINVIAIHMPALRERREDIPPLVDHFLAKFSDELTGARKSVTPEAMACLARYEWPGNVRELENEIQRAIALSDEAIEPDILSENIVAGKRAAPDAAEVGAKPLKEIVRAETERVERHAILEALRRSSWKKNQASKLLGISRPTLDAKIDAYGLRDEIAEGGRGGK